MDSLSGHFLIATPHMPDPRFRGQVIYLCAHNETGIMGLVVNNPSPEITLHDILLGANLTRSEERRVGKECRSRWSPYH